MTGAFDPGPVTLRGEVVVLEPLRVEHAADLFVAGGDESIWTYLPRGPFASEDDVRGWVAEALARADTGTDVPFAVLLRESGRVVGSTRFLDVRRDDRGLEIGWTWIATDQQRTAVNTECKLLLLTHAFEELGAARVQLKTDARNLRSQRAIERVGAVREGVLRRHMLVRGGVLRDSAYYSVLDDEWPVVKAKLLALRERTSA